MGKHYSYKKKRVYIFTYNFFTYNFFHASGAFAAGIPGEVKGMWNLHQKFGKLKWEDLIKPAINIAEEGVRVNKPLANAIQAVKKKVASKGMEMLPGLK